jgi:hypothetical protein
VAVVDRPNTPEDLARKIEEANRQGERVRIEMERYAKAAEEAGGLADSAGVREIVDEANRLLREHGDLLERLNRDLEAELERRKREGGLP